MRDDDDNLLEMRLYDESYDRQDRRRYNDRDYDRRNYDRRDYEHGYRRDYDDSGYGHGYNSRDYGHGYNSMSRRNRDTYYDRDRRPFFGRGRSYDYNRSSNWFNRNRGYNDYTRSGRNYGRGYRREGSSGSVILYIIVFCLVAVAFKWFILQNKGLTFAAIFILIMVFLGHLRDK